MTITNLFTVDVEDWYHGTQFDNSANWHRHAATGSADRTVTQLLELLARHRVRATFFWLGHLAALHPALVRAVADAGHECASHGWSHRRLWLLSPATLREELQRTDEAISAALGHPHRSLGYRAPYFTMHDTTVWALGVLRAHGMRYDASVLPALNYLGGAARRPRFPHDWHGLREFPVSTLRCAGINVPFSGGFYLRALPLALVRRGVQACNRAGQPAIVYLHPRELDPEQPRLPMPWWQAATYYYKLDAMQPKLEALLAEFPFGSIAEALP